MIPAYALYRRSTSHQDLSIEEQRAEVMAWAEAHGYEIIREFRDDASGLDTARRREFQALLDLCSDARRREAGIVLCYDVSRFSRLDPDEAAFHEHSLRRAGVRVVYTHEPGANEGGVAGHLTKALKRVMAHEYSLKLSQLVQRGLRAHAERGDWTGGRPPYGFRRAIRLADGGVQPLSQGRWKAKGEHVVIVADPVEAAVLVESIFAPYVQGKGIAAIAVALNARGVPPPASDRRAGAMVWSKGTLWAILRNPVYVGRLVYAKARYSEIGKKRGKVRRPAFDQIVVENAVPPIVPRALWEAAQRRHGSRRFGVGRPYHRPYLLSSLIRCAACGKSYQGKRMPRSHAAYYCCGGRLAIGPTVCDSPSVPMVYLDEAVLDGIVKRLDIVLDADELRRRVTALLAQDQSTRPVIPEIEARLRETERRIARLVETLAAGTDQLPSVRAALVGLERERERLGHELAAARARGSYGSGRVEVIADELVSALNRLRDILNGGTSEERKAVVRAFLHGITIDKTTRAGDASVVSPAAPGRCTCHVGGAEGIRALEMFQTRQTIPRQHRLPAGLVDPDSLQKGADDGLSLLSFPNLEYVREMRQNRGERLDRGFHVFRSCRGVTGACLCGDQFLLQALPFAFEPDERVPHAGDLLGA
jgi:DNA invertase Pin-like site-specific DNA recombinase